MDQKPIEVVDPGDERLLKIRVVARRIERRVRKAIRNNPLPALAPSPPRIGQGFSDHGPLPPIATST